MNHLFQINPRRWQGLSLLLPEDAPFKEGDARRPGRTVTSFAPDIIHGLAAAADHDCEVFIEKTREHSYKCGCDQCVHNLLTLDSAFPEIRERLAAQLKAFSEVRGVVSSYDLKADCVVVIASREIPLLKQEEDKPAIPETHRSFIWSGDVGTFHQLWRAD